MMRWEAYVVRKTQLVFHKTVGMSKDNSCHTTIRLDITVVKIPVLYDNYITTAYC